MIRRDNTTGAFIAGRTLEYVINLDERGEFYADVRNEIGQTVWETEGFEIFEDGFMRNKNDIAGLADYLRSLGIMGAADTLTKG